MTVILFDELPHNVGQLTLNRPRVSNAFSTELLETLLEHLRRIEREKKNRVLILRGAGNIFCGGLDLRLASQEENASRLARLVADVLIQLRKMTQIVIAAVHGAACAGGAALILASDLVIAAEGFKIGFPEVRRGLEPALLFPLLRRKLTDSAIRQLVFTGLPVDAERAKELGIIQYIVPAMELLELAQTLAEEICLGEPNAVRAAKKQLQSFDQEAFETEMNVAVCSHIQSWTSDAAQEGIQAFLEKRPPNWLAD